MDSTINHDTQVELQNPLEPMKSTRKSVRGRRYSLPSNNQDTTETEAQLHLGELSSPGDSEDGGNFRKSLEIDMKGLVGDAVGNMSISPASRDVVLAARRGLFIIDLEAPFEVPRFLPQGGTWDVADVQWNPHPGRAEYIVSTSSEKLLIWNLMMSGKTSIEHILHSHYRAITDINWHTTEHDTVVSTGIDSWVWAWDIREPRKPIFGLCAFNAPGTQVKWNRQDANILASSHADQVLIWDRRKGSLPITTIQGHTSRIYGIDWSHSARDEIVTCSLDKTIKLWNINESAVDGDSARVSSSSDEHSRVISTARIRSEPKATIRTTYPVWRARNLPFGRGVLSLAQRGETALEMYAVGGERQVIVPVETYEGHTDVVKEFVWRRGGYDGSEFQLITWSKDRTLRFWPVDSDTMQKVGYTPVLRGRSRPLGDAAFHDQSTTSFRNPPEDSRGLPLLSAPIGNRSILAEVRAGLPPRRRNNSLNLPPRLSNSFIQENVVNAGIQYRSFLHSLNDEAHLSSSAASNDTLHSSSVKRMAASGAGGGTMSRGAAGSKLRARVDALSWLTSVKVGEKRRGSSSGAGSRANSGEASRMSSRSAGRSKNDTSVTILAGSKRRRSESRSRAPGEDREVGQSLQDEITSVLAKLPASKIRLEKHDLTKKRTCTLGLQGPWGANSSVFLRITFTFPKEYPQGIYPDGTPAINLEHTPLITMKDRAFILRRLRTLRESRRPCLEACLRFLLFRNEDERADTTIRLDSESSSDDDDEPGPRKSREVTVSLLRNNKNLAEPRTSQGSFGPNGELVCFFRAPPRIVRNIMNGLSRSPAKASDRATPGADDAGPRIFQSPSLVADAVRRLGLAATDRYNRTGEVKRESGEHITRIMTNLLTFPRHAGRRESESVPSEDVPNAFALVAPRRSTVFIANTSIISGGDSTVAAHYIFASHSLLDVCDVNAAFARAHGRYDHERVFRTLGAVLGTGTGNVSTGRKSSRLAKRLLDRLLSELRGEKDVQMLAMVATIILQAFCSSPVKNAGHVPPPHPRSRAPSTRIIGTLGGLDYFTSRHPRSSVIHAAPLSPIGPAVPLSPSALQHPASISSSASSRGSWSSLFNTGGMRQFVNGMQESLKDGSATPSELPPTISGPWIAVPRHGRVLRGPDSPIPIRRSNWRESVNVTPPAVSRSWSESIPIPKGTPTSPPTGHQRPTFSQVANYRAHSTKEKRIVFVEPTAEKQEPAQSFTTDDIKLLNAHVQFYAEMLFSWQLFHKRIELLKSVPEHHATYDSKPHSLGLVRTCSRCASLQVSKLGPCESCGNSCSMPTCTICRLSVKGLSISCVRCLHVAHVSCWKSLRIAVCPSGCGCACEVSGSYVSPSMIQSPQSISRILK